MAAELAVNVIFQFEQVLIKIVQREESIDTLKGIVTDTMKDPTEAEKKAKAEFLKILNNSLMGVTQQMVDSKITENNYTIDEVVEINLACRLVAYCVAQLSFNVVSGIISRNIADIIARSKAGLLKDRETELRREYFAQWKEVHEAELAEEENKKVLEDEKRWAEWDSLSDAERAARTFEMAEALTMGGAQTKTTSGKTPEEIEKEKRDKAEAEKRLEAEALEGAAKQASAKLIKELEEKVMIDFEKFMVGTFNMWAVENGSGNAVADEAADIAAKCLQAYTAEGETSQALQVFEGLVLGRMTKEVVDEVRDWFALRAKV